MKSPLKFITVLFCVFALAGCAASEKNDPNTLTVWHWMSDREEAFQELARRYEDSNHIKVKFELYAPSEAYTQRVKAAAQTSTLPDIFGVLGESRDFASFVKSGHVADLTEEFHKKEGSRVWKDKLFEKAVSVNQFLPGKIRENNNIIFFSRALSDNFSSYIFQKCVLYKGQIK